MGVFKDHFSHSSSQYQKYRPTYPDDLFKFLAMLCHENHYAWDVGAGNGQAALKLSNYFEKVLATDPSANQIKSAVQNSNIQYDISRAESCPASDQSFDLITVAQAFHWFNFDQFYAEVNRVAKKGAFLAVWTYTLVRIDPKVDILVEHFYHNIVGQYWPAERRHVETQYENIPFPFEQIEAPKFYIELNYSMNDLLKYLATWSAVKNYRLKNDADPIELIREDVMKVWVNPEEIKKIVWPINLKIGRVK